MCSQSTHLETTVTLAESGRRAVFPNPMVGAVIVKEGKVIATGYHARYGDLHAEAAALQDAGTAAAGSTLYCNLEPCSYTAPDKHQPPCTSKIIASGVKKVVVGQLDPNPAIRGRGVRKLREAGIDVVTDPEPERFWRFNDAFNSYMALGRPFLHLKSAMSLDGRIATYRGDSKWITNESARREVHRFRSEREGILVGVGTVIADDPLLTVRHLEGRSPRPVVIDSTLRIPEDARLVTERASELLVVAARPPAEDPGFNIRRRRLEELGVTVEVVPAASGRVELGAAMRRLLAYRLRSIFVEGGATLVTALLREQLFDRLTLYIAPILIGSGIDGVGDLDVTSIAEAKRFEDPHWRTLDGQLVFDGYRAGWYREVSATVRESTVAGVRNAKTQDETQDENQDETQARHREECHHVHRAC